MGLFSKFRKDRQYKEEELPWYGLRSIYGHLSDHVGEDGKLTEAAMNLPDEERRYSGSNIRWAPGALDGAFGHHAGGQENAEEIKNIVEMVSLIARSDAQAAKVALYEMLTEDNLLSFIDGLVEEILGAKIPIEPHLHRFLRWLAFDAPDRGPVKFGISLLGLIGDHRDAKKLFTLGLHDEFTLYVAVAIGNSMEDPEPTLWRLAQLLDGWGRIQIVERLAETGDPKIKRWMVREGFRNSIMNEYLAYVCAVAGDLLAQLQAGDVDEDLLNGTSDLVYALIGPGPAADLTQYEDGSEVVAVLVEQMRTRAQTFAHYLTLQSVREFLEGEEDWESLRRLGWTEDHRTNLLIDLHPILVDPRWHELVAQNLDAEDDFEFHQANMVAKYLEIDMWTTHFARVQADPTQAMRWFNLMQATGDERIDEVIVLAESLLPLQEIASGPAEENGLGEEFMPHQCLDFIVQDIGHYPGRGIRLIYSALRSPVIRNRHLAIRALATWGEHQWPEGMRTQLEAVRKEEPFTETQELLDKVLTGQELE
ncbi:MAG: hypothetical protein AAGN35_12240 [Bacteroidota bacterium]